MCKNTMIETKADCDLKFVFEVWGISSFGFVSDFEFRASDFGFNPDLSRLRNTRFNKTLV